MSGAGPRFRPATVADAPGLRDLERAANLVGLAHVFPAADFPFPDAAVLARWEATLAEPGVAVEVVDGPGRLDCFAAYDATTLRHLAVHPGSWGRGLAGAGIDRAVAAIRAGGEDRALLWCLDENHRARGLYAHRGWVAGELTRRASWPPHPVERRWSLSLPPPGADGA